MPRRSGFPRGEEVESRGWGRRAPQSPSSSSFGAPQGNNKIYKSDEVFLIEESKNKRPKPNAVSLSAPQGTNKIYTYSAVFPIGETNTPKKADRRSECKGAGQSPASACSDGDQSLQRNVPGNAGLELYVGIQTGGERGFKIGGIDARCRAEV